MGCKTGKCKKADPCRQVTICECPIKDLQTDCSVYVGEDLQNINVRTGTILTSVIWKISKYLDSLRDYIDRSFEIRNEGTGETLYIGNFNVDGAKEFKTLTSGENINIETSNNNKEIIISATASGGGGIVYTPGANISISEDNEISSTDTKYTQGANVSISESNVISSIDTKYSAGDNISISQEGKISSIDTTYSSGTDISIGHDNTINYTGSGGATYTASNIGAGEGIYHDTGSNNFQFKTITEGSGISIESTGDEVTITNNFKEVRPAGYVFRGIPLMDYHTDLDFGGEPVGEEYGRVLNLVFDLSIGYYGKKVGGTVYIRDSKVQNVDLGEEYLVEGEPSKIKDFSYIRDKYITSDSYIEYPNTLRLNLSNYENTFDNKYILDESFIQTLKNKGTSNLELNLADGVEVHISSGNENELGLEITGGKVTTGNYSTTKYLKLINTELERDTDEHESALYGLGGSSIEIKNTVINSAERIVETSSNLTIEGGSINGENAGTTIFAFPESKVVLENVIIGRPEVILIPSTIAETPTSVELKGNKVTFSSNQSLIKIEETVDDSVGIEVKSFGNNLNESTIVTPSKNNALKISNDYSEEAITMTLKRFNSSEEAITSVGYNKLYVDEANVVKYTGDAR